MYVSPTIEKDALISQTQRTTQPNDFQSGTQDKQAIESTAFQALKTKIKSLDKTIKRSLFSHTDIDDTEKNISAALSEIAQLNNGSEKTRLLIRLKDFPNFCSSHAFLCFIHNLVENHQNDSEMLDQLTILLSCYHTRTISTKQQQDIIDHILKTLSDQYLFNSNVKQSIRAELLSSLNNLWKRKLFTPSNLIASNLMNHLEQFCVKACDYNELHIRSLSAYNALLTFVGTQKPFNVNKRIILQKCFITILKLADDSKWIVLLETISSLLKHYPVALQNSKDQKNWNIRRLVSFLCHHSYSVRQHAIELIKALCVSIPSLSQEILHEIKNKLPYINMYPQEFISFIQHVPEQDIYQHKKVNKKFANISDELQLKILQLLETRFSLTLTRKDSEDEFTQTILSQEQQPQNLELLKIFCSKSGYKLIRMTSRIQWSQHLLPRVLKILSSIYNSYCASKLAPFDTFMILLAQQTKEENNLKLYKEYSRTTSDFYRNEILKTLREINWPLELHPEIYQFLISAELLQDGNKIMRRLNPHLQMINVFSILNSASLGAHNTDDAITKTFCKINWSNDILPKVLNHLININSEFSLAFMGKITWPKELHNLIFSYLQRSMSKHPYETLQVISKISWSPELLSQILGLLLSKSLQNLEIYKILNIINIFAKMAWKQEQMDDILELFINTINSQYSKYEHLLPDLPTYEYIRDESRIVALSYVNWPKRHLENIFKAIKSILSESLLNFTSRLQLIDALENILWPNELLHNVIELLQSQLLYDNIEVRLAALQALQALGQFNLVQNKLPEFLEFLKAHLKDYYGKHNTFDILRELATLNWSSDMFSSLTDLITTFGEHHITAFSKGRQANQKASLETTLKSKKTVDTFLKRPRTLIFHPYDYQPSRIRHYLNWLDSTSPYVTDTVLYLSFKRINKTTCFEEQALAALFIVKAGIVLPIYTNILIDVFAEYSANQLPAEAILKIAKQLIELKLVDHNKTLQEAIHTQCVKYLLPTEPFENQHQVQLSALYVLEHIQLPPTELIHLLEKFLIAGSNQDNTILLSTAAGILYERLILSRENETTSFPTDIKQLISDECVIKIEELAKNSDSFSIFQELKEILRPPAQLLSAPCAQAPHSCLFPTSQVTVNYDSEPECTYTPQRTRPDTP